MSPSTDSHRLNILTTEEIDALYGFPKFTDNDRHLYFDLSLPERAAVISRTPATGAYLALELGYFKARHQFFDFEPEAVKDDLRYLLKNYFPGLSLTKIKAPSRPTRRLLQKTILALFSYRLCNSTARNELEEKAMRIAMLSTQPLYILREILQYLSNECIVVPQYSTLQDLVGKVVTHERNRVAHLLEKAITPQVRQALDSMLQADEQMYRITTLRHEPKNFSHKQLKQEVERRQFFLPLHEFALSFLADTGISSESGKYYASLVKFYTVYKLQRMLKGVTRLYLLCFAFHRYRQINDNLIGAFIHHVNHYEKSARIAAEAALTKAIADTGSDLKAAGEVLRLFIDNSIANDMPFSTVQEKAFSLLEQERFPAVADYLRNVAFDKVAFQWDYYTSASLAFKRNLRHLFCALDFAGRVEDAPLLEAVTFLQASLRQGKSLRQTKPELFPVALIPNHLKRYLFTEIAAEDEKSSTKQLDVDRYEFLIYRLVRNALEAGDVFVTDSNEFRRFEDDLISDQRWEHRGVILQEIGAPLLLAPIEETLSTFREALNTRFAEVNKRISESANQHIKLTGRAEKRRWKLIYPTAEEPTNNPFYAQLPGIGIADLLKFVADATGFLNRFSHVLDRYIKRAPDSREILACIVAFGTNMGLGKMSEVSGMSFAQLQGTARNYLRLETLRAANDAISNAIATLPAFHLFNIRDEIHSSSDGQHLETQINTFNARHAPKYFGLQKGVSACTLIANHVPINVRIIGTHEHESHYVFDLLYNNTSDIKQR